MKKIAAISGWLEGKEWEGVAYRMGDADDPPTDPHIHSQNPHIYPQTQTQLYILDGFLSIWFLWVSLYQQFQKWPICIVWDYVVFSPIFPSKYSAQEPLSQQTSMPRT